MMTINQESASSRMRLTAAMLIFGTIGIFRSYIPLSSGMLAMLRGFLGMGFLLMLLLIRRKPLDRAEIRRNLVPLLISGSLIGLNWIALFEAYRYTSVAVATLCYYMAPVLVILASPFLLKEPLPLRKGICAGVAFLGMVFVSGVLSGGVPELWALKGIGLGLLAACLYACVILMNKKMGPIGAYDKTILQLGAAGLVLLPYNLLLPGSFQSISLGTGLLVGLVGILHTGIAYALYFSSMEGLKAQTVALYSYIDPIAAILLSMVIFREDMGLHGWIGAVLVLGATFASERIGSDG